jgi:DNA repair photolyase
MVIVGSLGKEIDWQRVHRKFRIDMREYYRRYREAVSKKEKKPKSFEDVCERFRELEREADELEKDIVQGRMNLVKWADFAGRADYLHTLMSLEIGELSLHIHIETERPT